MAKKKSGAKYQTEEEVYEDLQRLIPIWKQNYSYNAHRGYLSSIKREFRSPRICGIIFSNPDVFKLEEEIKYMPLEMVSEEVLIQMVYDNPKILCSKDDNGPRLVPISEEKQTLPVLVAFELGKRRDEKYSAMQWGKYGEKIPYTGKTLEYRSTIVALADTVEEQIVDLREATDFKNPDEKEVFTNLLVEEIQKAANPVSLEADKRYVPRYRHLDYNSDKKMLILISGYADSGKTTFSHYLADSISGAICFDSDQLYISNKLDYKLSELIDPEQKVVVFSDLEAFHFFRTQEIEDAMGDPNILKVYMKPSSVKRMLQHSKYRQR